MHTCFIGVGPTTAQRDASYVYFENRNVAIKIDDAQLIYSVLQPDKLQGMTSGWRALPLISLTQAQWDAFVKAAKVKVV